MQQKNQSQYSIKEESWSGDYNNSQHFFEEQKFDDNNQLQNILHQEESILIEDKEGSIIEQKLQNQNLRIQKLEPQKLEPQKQCLIVKGVKKMITDRKFNNPLENKKNQGQNKKNFI
ncbi:hypothetical protein [Lyticum sinuosum]|uniref:Uncharacterized protein n=1 Tax=Lyticum sinuosum TaxID=1332059 RepID=A0AAE5AGN6_9RICK|nr:hypothetical protein [Lyticum sinuosum]MDZ5760967.1 hypothetical protein [Lyticum sinuosum]